MIDRLLTPTDAAERLQVPVSWVYERTRMNAMPGLVRIGKYVRIRESELNVFIESGGESANKD
jgi:excisionase family DNA binding protein